MTRQDIRNGIGLLWLILTFCVWTSASYGKKSPSRGQTLVYCAVASPQTFNPELATDGATFNASSQQIYNRLVKLNNSTMQIEPSLAQSWQISPDGKVITFHLRKGVKFQKTPYFTPTRDFDADDVIFTFHRMLSAKNPFHDVGGGVYPDFEAEQMPSLIARIEKINNLTVRFVLTQPEAPFLADLAMDFASILSKQYADQLIRQHRLADIDSKPVGTGPFIFQSYLRGRLIRYTANPDYFLGKPKIEHLVFRIVTSPRARLHDLITGRCQIDGNLPPDAIDIIRRNPKLKLLASPGLNLSYLTFNVRKMPFASLKFRKAVYYALNRESYIKAIYDNQAEVAKNPIPPTMWSFDRKIRDYHYDPEEARKLLKQLGLPKGFKVTLWCPHVARPYNPNPLKMAELIKRDLDKVGIDVNVKTLGWVTFLKKSRAGELPFSLQGWTGDNGDPDNFLNTLLSCDSISSGDNRAHWCDRRFSFEVDRARVTTNVRIRTRFYQRAQQIFHQQIPWVPIAYSTIFKALRKDVRGYQVSPFGVDYFGSVYYK